jgi:hypothetical protein
MQRWLEIRHGVHRFRIQLSQDGIHAIGTRYQLLKGDRDKAVYRDLETDHKIKIEIHN